MPCFRETQVSEMKVRDRTSRLSTAGNTAVPSGTTAYLPGQEHKGSFLKTITVAAALVLCAVTLRTGAVPSLQPTADAVMTAATDNSLLDDQLGKLSFVSALFPEAVLVFGNTSDDKLTLPVSAGYVVHAWSEAEPYISWRSSDTIVSSALTGEVMGVYHGNGDERLVQIQSDNGLSCLYGNLAEVRVQTGDNVSAGDLIGTLTAGEDFVMEVRKNGLSIDPAIFFAQ